MNDVCEEILITGCRDIIQYLAVYCMVCKFDNMSPSIAAGEAAIAAASTLILAGYAFAGPVQTEETRWLVIPTATAENDPVAVLRDLVRDCEHPPEMWSGFWIQLTESGKAVGEQLWREWELQSKNSQ